MREILLAVSIAVGSCIYGCGPNKTVECVDFAVPGLRAAFNDACNIAQQGSLDAANAVVTSTGDAGDRQKALVAHNHRSEQIAYLKENFERYMSVLLLGRTYAASNEPYLKVLANDINTALEKQEAEKPNE